MQNGELQQIFDSINKANQILLVLPATPSGDGLGAGLALFDFLRKLDKEPEIVSQNGDQGTFSFLPSIKEMKNKLQAHQSFVISVSTGTAKLDELSYEIIDDRVDIFLKPKSGHFSKEQVQFGRARFPYDLIIALDTPSLDHLGAIYEDNTDLFFETTVINIDHHPNNEHYGEINFVDLTSTSTSEIVATLIEEFEASLIDENIATNLLTGIIVETNSFQHVKTTPRAFLKASTLVSAGANQQQIIKELYKTKNISLLKLWGRALARIREVPELQMTYSLISLADVKKSGASARDVFHTLKELVASLSESKIVALLAETGEREVTGYFHLHPSVKSQVVSSVLGGQMINGSYGKFVLKDMTLLEAEKEVIEKLKKMKSQIAV